MYIYVAVFNLCVHACMYVCVSRCDVTCVFPPYYSTFFSPDSYTHIRTRIVSTHMAHNYYVNRVQVNNNCGCRSASDMYMQMYSICMSVGV